MKSLVLIAAVVLALAVTACSSGGHDHGGDAPHHPQAGAAVVPGEVADDSDADRKVTVVASDELRFDPASLEVRAGEVITFVVRNEGKTEHEFVLGDDAYQEQHEMEMAGGGHHMSGMDNAVTIPPGETTKLTWRFPESGEVLYGCHVPGHYDGGMVGTVEVG